MSDDCIHSTKWTVYVLAVEILASSAASIIDQCQDHAGSETRDRVSVLVIVTLSRQETKWTEVKTRGNRYRNSKQTAGSSCCLTFNLKNKPFLLDIVLTYFIDTVQNFVNTQMVLFIFTHYGNI